MAVIRIAALALAVAACNTAESAHPRLELIEAPATQDVAVFVTQQLVSADAAHKRLLVYVGASWCEPCRRFHEAAAAGQLDADFGNLRFLVFDADRDKDALQHAGYVSDLIPLFALPKPDGTSSGKQIEGSIKGDGAVAQITPRLKALLQN
jgi:thiol-disulfide isomerase/thioredoxin